MKTADTKDNKDISITFQNKEYMIEIDKLLVVLSALSSKKVEFTTKEEIINLMQYYCLFDEFFLENINKLKIEKKNALKSYP